ncbi:MAG: DUF6457 domain-containing protein [Actinomycetota bacterium]|nr:DUF6457 domain-containing protein [Actinomycetota bacterium]
MSDWLRRYAVALGEEPLTTEEVAAILELARDVAHGTERKFAPLSTFLAGIHAAARIGQDGLRLDALSDAIEIARRLVGDAESSLQASSGEQPSGMPPG